MPLQQIPRCRDRDDDAGAGSIPGGPADKLAHGLGCRPAQLAEQLAATPEERPQQPRDGQHDMAVCDLLQHLLTQPLGPKDLPLLLARRAEAAAAAGEGDEHAAPALPAPEPSEAMLDEPAAQELPQHPFHHRTQGAVLAREALRPDTQQLVEVPFDQLQERRLARLPRPVHPAIHLHAQPQAGGESPAKAGGQPACPCRRVSPGSVPSRRPPRASRLPQDGGAQPVAGGRSGAGHHGAVRPEDSGGVRSLPHRQRGRLRRRACEAGQPRDFERAIEGRHVPCGTLGACFLD